MVHGKRDELCYSGRGIVLLSVFLMLLPAVLGDESDSLSILSQFSDHALLINQVSQTSASTSRGGSVLLDNTKNSGAGMVLYTNNGIDSTGRLFNVRCDNVGFSQDCLHVDNDGGGNALGIVSTNGNGVSISSYSNARQKSALTATLFADSSDESSALTATSFNTEYSAAQISGVEKDSGTLKVSHLGDGSDSEAAAISVMLKGPGTKSQAIFIDAEKGTMGNLLSINNGGERLLTLNHMGFLGLNTYTPTSILDINGDRMRLRRDFSPSSSRDDCQKGEIAWDEDFVYVCIRNNEWRRAYLEAW